MARNNLIFHLLELEPRTCVRGYALGVFLQIDLNQFFNGCKPSSRLFIKKLHQRNSNEGHTPQFEFGGTHIQAAL